MQSVVRASAILRLLAQRAPNAARLVDIAGASELPLATTRRILKTLIEEKLVIQDDKTRTYRLGSMIFELGLAASKPAAPHLEGVSRALRDLATDTGDQVTLIGRSDAEVVCQAIEPGRNNIHSFPLAVGTRRPLGVGAGGFAVLAKLPDDEVDRIIHVNLPQVSFFGKWTTASIWRAIERTRDRGYGISICRIAPEVRSIGMVLQSFPGHALTIMGPDTDIAGKRIDDLAEMLRATCAKVDGIMLGGRA